MHNSSSKILYGIKQALNYLKISWDGYVHFKMSRNDANQHRKKIVEKKGESVIDQVMRKEIKEYCRDVLGSESYWPWLELYTELRGEFKEGWMPDDYYRFKLLPKMNPEKFMKFSEAKTIDHKLFKDSIIEPLFFYTNGQYCLTDGTIKTESGIQRILNEINDEIIIKPDDGRGGKRIKFRHSRKIKLNELPLDTDLVFQNVVKQHPELNKLYPHSINTLRVLTYIDRQGHIKIKFVIIRFGQGGVRVDNASSGGGWVFVQLNGKVKPMAYNLYGLELDTWYPDTKTEYAKLELPFLHKVTTLCKKVHRSFPYARIIGWDVYVNENEEPKLIEWNANNPLFWAVEAQFGPFFEECIT